MARRNPARQQQAAKAQATHKGPQQDANGNRRGPNDQFQQLQPDNLIDQSGSAAEGEQDKQEWKHAESK